MENQFTENDNFTQAKKQFSTLGLMYFLGSLLIFGVQFAASFIAGNISENAFSSTAAALLITMIPMYVIAMPLMGLLICRIPAVTIEKKRMSAGQWIIAFIMCYGAMYASNLVGVFLTQIIGMVKGSEVTNSIFEAATGSTLLVNFFLMVICAPIAEELLFRKLLIDRTVKYGEGVAVLFSGLLFGLFHGNLNQFVYAFVLGLFFGFIYVKTGNVLYSTLLHMFVNFFGSILGVIVLRFINYDALVTALSDSEAMNAYMADYMGQLLIYGVYTLFILGIAIAGIILLIVNKKRMKLASGQVTIPKGKRFSTTILNVGMVIYFLFWIVIMIIQLFQ